MAIIIDTYAHFDSHEKMVEKPSQVGAITENKKKRLTQPQPQLQLQHNVLSLSFWRQTLLVVLLLKKRWDN